MDSFARFPKGGVYLAAALLITVPVTVESQVIRGTVIDRANAPAVGAVVTLVRPAANDTIAGTDIRSVLVDATGTFSVAAPQAGRYRIVVRRIGWRPFRSDVIDVGRGETARLDVQLEPLSHSTVVAALPEIRVTRASPCRTDRSEAARIATLWNDARTALLASEASRANASVPTLLIRYTRTLDLQDLGVLTEELQLFDHHDVGNARGFRSLSGDSLSSVGYWHRVNASTTTFHGPDANALLSGAFVRDHCFELVDSTATEAPSTVGLLFEPVRARRRPGAPPEIRGAAWFDATSSRLQRVEFSWFTLPGLAPTTSPASAQRWRLGGELAFAYGPGGAVYVDRWYLRMPQDIVEITGSYGAEKRVHRQQIIEEGGIVFADSMAVSAGSASLRGDLRVDGRRPLRGAMVRVLGTELSAVTDDDGRFTFAQVPAGLRVLVADHPSMSAFGLRAAVSRVLLDAGENRMVSLVAPDQEGIATNLCGENALSGNRALLRLTVVDSATTQPVADYPVRLVSRSSTQPPLEIERLTDASGVALFCELPANRGMVVSATGGAVLLSEFSLRRAQLASRHVWVQR